jgi:hypothetical protein
MNVCEVVGPLGDWVNHVWRCIRGMMKIWMKMGLI